MNAERKVYEPGLFLTCDMRECGASMIEFAGQIHMASIIGDSGHDTRIVREMQDAVTKAQQSIDGYRRAQQSGRKLLTREEYREAAP